MRPGQIISGGQTGVDRGALAAARRLGIPWGGWAPRGWLAEDGAIPAVFRERMIETYACGYTTRTRKNIVDADATIVVVGPRRSPGTELTIRLIRECSAKSIELSAMTDVDLAAALARAFVDSVIPDAVLLYGVSGPPVVNVAGPRESRCPGVQAWTEEMLVRAFG